MKLLVFKSLPGELEKQLFIGIFSLSITAVQNCKKGDIV